jgi:hypothetical protein
MELDIISDMARALYNGGFEGLARSTGFMVLAIGFGALLIMSGITVAIGLDDVCETPLARYFGIKSRSAPRPLGEIEEDWKDLETWRDLDGDNTRDF